MPTVLLTNDDGPPSATESPYVFGLYQFLTTTLKWNVKVVLPVSQKSWIGKAFHIKELTTGSYYYPRLPDGSGETTATSRPLRDGEIAEWILLDGTPATCANVALHNLFPGQFDLVISGPNLGRNTSAAFSLSSGTIGAAMSASISGVRSIALSYGTVIHPTPTSLFEPAHILGARIIQHLWNNWGSDEAGLRPGEVDLYSVNIPLIERLLDPDGLAIYSTSIWRNSYHRLFKQLPQGTDKSTTSVPGSELIFKWAPDMKNLINPTFDSLPMGSDAWALAKDAASVTALRGSFAEPPSNHANVEERRWKIKL